MIEHCLFLIIALYCLTVNLILFRDPEDWKYRSADGFIGKDESILELCIKDIESIHSLGYTKESFVLLIINAMNEADKYITGMNMPFKFTFHGISLSFYSL